jgi:hypothetical protein
VGTLGDGSTTQRTNFVKATGLSNIAAIYMGEAGTGGSSAGETVAAAVDTSGNVFFVGYNPYGGLGTGNATNYTTYQAVNGAWSGKVAKVVFSGNAFSTSGSTYILTTDGRLYASGYNSVGQLGVGDTNNRNTFTEVLRNTNGAKVVDVHAFGFSNSEYGAYITLDDGTMMATGANNYGATGGDVQVFGNKHSFRYVQGFEPGAKANQFAGSLIPFSLITGATLGNVLDNLDFTQTWNWSTTTSANALVMNANNLTSGALQTLTTNSVNFAGSLLNIISSGNSASSTGSLAKLEVQGANSSSTALKILNAGTGLSVDVTGGLALRAGSNFSAVGVTENAPLGNASLIRMTGATAQTLGGITGGTNGLLLTLMNAGAATTTLKNNSGASAAVNRIITGTGADLDIKSGASIMLQYDGTTNVWRVIGGTGGHL